MSDQIDRLKKFLDLRGRQTDCEVLTADASTREYFRINWSGSSAIACVYPQSSDPAAGIYIDVSKLFLSAGLPVAGILDFDEELAIAVQEDLGDNILANALKGPAKENRSILIDNAITLIAEIQSATGLAFERNSIASKLKFDTEKLLWELNYFREHYFGSYKGVELSDEETADLNAEFLELSLELESYASVLCHRDFHSYNLMLDDDGKLRIIDHQDARIGSPAYDLVSLLLDRVTEEPAEAWLKEKRNFLLAERKRLDLADIDESKFEYEFSLQTIQRCLKAAGTFSFQSVNRGKTYFVPFIKPMLSISIRRG